MKRLISALLVLALIIGMTGCVYLNNSLQQPVERPGTTESSRPASTEGTQAPEDNATDPTEAPTQPTPEETQPTQPKPTEPTQPKPTEPKPTEPKPTQPKPTEPTRPKPTQPTQPIEPDDPDEPLLDRNGTYTSKEDVALYIHQYGRLPNNFITKSQAKALGWKSGSLERFAPGKCIGGDTFQNREGLLPKKAGRTYKECDIDTLGKSQRGTKRIVFSNDGLVYYTSDHYQSFVLLYGEP